MLPTANPSAVVADATESVALPAPLAPGVMAAVPTVVLPIEKVTLPASVPAVADCTAAVSWSAPSIATVVGFAVSVVLVFAIPEAVTFTVVDALETKKPPGLEGFWPEYAACTVCAPPVAKLVVTEATPAAKVVLGCAAPSMVKVTVPPGTVVPEAAATVAVRVTATPTAGAAGATASLVVVPMEKLAVANAVARLLPSTDPSPDA